VTKITKFDRGPPVPILVRLKLSNLGEMLPYKKCRRHLDIEHYGWIVRRGDGIETNKVYWTVADSVKRPGYN